MNYGNTDTHDAFGIKRETNRALFILRIDARHDNRAGGEPVRNVSSSKSWDCRIVDDDVSPEERPEVAEEETEDWVREM